ncbi:unnamed protein product (mitochondrion) [Plasmodiophora brassicae]|uniref:PHD-type domain-containing protein n=1 Tax=Plasmodiophora brassicae TaxID=37360 RepID=A0A0G4INI0_PLABS|nr:hypothetical protein PBRA_005395 [Plasmodiophora brassicae]SPR00671.1 unnamed protein product [Plasmodiophora brassicae]
MSFTDGFMEIEPVTPDYFEDSDEEPMSSAPRHTQSTTSTPPMPTTPQPPFPSQPRPVPNNNRLMTPTNIHAAAAPARSPTMIAGDHAVSEKQASPNGNRARDTNAELRDFEAFISEYSSKGTQADIVVLHTALMAKQRGSSVCLCRIAQRCRNCLSCQSHCRCPKSTSEAAGNSIAQRIVQQHQQQQAQQPQSRKVPAAGTQPARLPSQSQPQRQQHQQQQQQQPQRRPPPQFIGDLAQMYVTRKTNLAGLACDPCSSKVPPSHPHQLTCDGCSRMAHISCITRLPDLLPQPPWYCKQCFPEASHIYYPGSLKPLSATEVGRVTQIVQGAALRLPLNVQIQYVEGFMKRVQLSGHSRVFIHTKGIAPPKAS